MPQAQPSRRPNVIWVFGDQHRGQAMGYRGDPNVRTPNMDRLATDGVRFDQAVAGAPWCTPFRASLLTGLYPHQHGAYATPSAVRPGTPTIAQPFRQAGYHTAWFGKWHISGSNNDVIVPPESRGGFDHWLGYENNNAQYRCFVHGTGQEEPMRLEGYETDALTDLMTAHLTSHVQRTADGQGGYQPFFAALSVQPPHNPYVAPADYARRHGPGEIELRPNVPRIPRVEAWARRDLAGYYSMIENLDDNLGRVRETLRRLNIDQETIILFFSDHGDMLGSHGQQHKSSPWEESIRIPMIFGSLQRGGVTRAATANPGVLNHVDIGPTTLGLCGIAKPDFMVGHNYAPDILHPGNPNHQKTSPPVIPPAPPVTPPDSAFLQQIPSKRHAHSVNRPWRAVVTTDNWKYVVQPGHDWLMFNLNEDPYEQANLVFDEVFKDQRARLHARLTQWIEETGDRFDMPSLSY